MKINNVSVNTSAKVIVFLSIISVFILVCLILAYSTTDATSWSVFGFFKWLFWGFQALRDELSEDPLVPWIILLLILGCFVGLVGAVVYRCRELKKFRQGLNVKYINLLPGLVEFIFTKPEYNFSCASSEVENLDMDIETTLVHTKNGSHVAFQQLNLTFTVLNNKKFELSNTSVTPINTIYKIIDYSREFKNFEYHFSGYGAIADFREKIDKYLQSGYKDIAGESGEIGMLISSVLTFFIGICMLIPFIRDIIKEPIFLLMFFQLALSFLVPIVIDIVLVVDKVRDYKYSFVQSQNDGRFWKRINVFHILVLKILVLIFIYCWLVLPVINSHNIEKKLNKISETPISTYRVLNDENSSDSDNWIDLHINSTSDYDYMTKREIYDLRKRYVGESVFARDDYEPNEDVFGQIVDNMPWWGDVSCDILDYKGDYAYRIEGDSKLSTMINNPAILVGLYKLFLPWKDPYYGDYCTADYSKFLPVSFKYNKKDNLFVVKYHVPPEFVKYKINVTGLNGGKNIPMQLSGINALDFGYRYVYGYDSKNIKILYQEDSDILRDVQTFQDFIHLGGSCQYEGGCNNLSPLQTGLIFNVQNLPAEISLKLWKKRPSNKNSKADAYFKIVFE